MSVGPTRARPQLVDEAVSYVRDQITSGTLPPGARVRPEVVAEELDISSTPAREALQTLRAEGLLDLAPRRGFTVARLTGDDIRDIYLVESFVAGELAARTAKTVTREMLARLEEMHAQLVAAAARGDLAEVEAWNYRFHGEINLAAASPKLDWVIELASRYVPRQFFATLDGWPETTIADHAEILDALRAGDARRVRRTMAEHIASAGEHLAQRVDERLAGADETSGA